MLPLKIITILKLYKGYAMKSIKLLTLSLCIQFSLSGSQKPEARAIAEQIIDQASEELFRGIGSKDIRLIENALRTGISANHDYTYRLTLAPGVYHEVKRTPLTYAASQPDSLPVVKTLILYGAHINKPDRENKLPLNVAIISNNTAVVDFFIAHHANLEAVDGENYGAIHQAIKSNATGILSQLLEAGANPNEKGGPFNLSPLFMAIDKDNKEMVTVLLNYGADSTGAFDYALKYGSLEMIRLLRAHQNKKYGQEALEKKPLE